MIFSLQRGEEQVELSTIEELIKDAIVSTQPAMLVNLRACSASGGLVRGSSKPGVLEKGLQHPYPLLTFLLLRYPVRSHLR